MKRELLALAARVEAATGADRELDFWISVRLGTTATDTDEAYQEDIDALGIDGMDIPHAYTASLDAALSLVPSGWVCTHAYFNDQRAVFNFTKWRDGNPMYASGVALTPALALTAAALRAIAERMPE